jgi:hypothetical protein
MCWRFDVSRWNHPHVSGDVKAWRIRQVGVRFETPHPLPTRQKVLTHFWPLDLQILSSWLPMFILLFTVDRETAYVTNHVFVKYRLRPTDTTQRLNMCVCATVCVCMCVCTGLLVYDIWKLLYVYMCICMFKSHPLMLSIRSMIPNMWFHIYQTMFSVGCLTLVRWDCNHDSINVSWLHHRSTFGPWVKLCPGGRVAEDPRYLGRRWGWLPYVLVSYPIDTPIDCND